jgi:hypothetical protein
MDSAAAPPIDTCPNCSTSLLGSHCHECGQKKIEANEYSLKRFIGQAINDFTDLESNKIFRTLSAMIFRPGLLAAEYLARRAGQLVSRAEIAAHVWDDSFDPFSNAIEVYMNRLRKKIDGSHAVKLLHTRRGEGYILEAR